MLHSLWIEQQGLLSGLETFPMEIMQLFICSYSICHSLYWNTFPTNLAATNVPCFHSHLTRIRLDNIWWLLLRFFCTSFILVLISGSFHFFSSAVVVTCIVRLDVEHDEVTFKRSKVYWTPSIDKRACNRIYAFGSSPCDESIGCYSSSS